LDWVSGGRGPAIWLVALVRGRFFFAVSFGF
jgi:hypothetical protein